MYKTELIALTEKEAQAFGFQIKLRFKIYD